MNFPPVVRWTFAHPEKLTKNSHPNFFFVGAAIPDLYSPFFVACMDFIDGEGEFCRCDDFPTDL
jgi:hypothetical protein